jgi:hypothetical protein
LIAEVVQDEIDENGTEGGEAMLAHIDRLYNSLLQKHAPASEAPQGSGHPATASVTTDMPCTRLDVQLGGRPQESEIKHGKSRVEPSRAPKQDVSPRGDASIEVEDGEALLANIDQLYNNVCVDSAALPSAVPEEDAASATAVPEAEPLSTAMLSTGGLEAQELRELLEEVLWSALLLIPGTVDDLNVQARLLELLPPQDLAQSFVACGSDALKTSLLQRLSAKLPGVHTALTCMSPRWSGSGMASIPSLVVKVRQVRDQLLILASTSAASVAGTPCSAPLSADSCAKLREREEYKKAKKEEAKKARKSSMSHWTADSLETMEAPPRRVARRIPAK